MHIVMFADQHLATLGGAQVSTRLQRRFLEQAGHTVTVVAPALHGQARARLIGGDDSSVDLPSIPITFDREYAMTWPGRRTDRRVDAALSRRPPVDVVHVQADFWGAFIGHRFAARHGIPIVHTMHNRVDVGIEETAPFPGIVLRVLNAWQRRMLGTSARGGDGWAYLRGLASTAAAVTAPSAHFARRLEEHGVFPRVDVIWNGMDDEILDAALTSRPPTSPGADLRVAVGVDSPTGLRLDPPTSPSTKGPAGDETRRVVGSGDGVSPSPTGISARGESSSPGRPRFVWLGRMSPEKRLLPFLDAVAESGIDAEVEVIGGGGQLRAARRIVERRRPRASVVFAGKLPYAETLRRIAHADAVVQTSIGFETQGMTIFEAASLGTPSVISDPDLAAELGSGFWRVGAGEADASVSALAAALRVAASDITAGTAPAPDPSIGERFRQSSRTAAMVEVYRRIQR